MIKKLLVFFWLLVSTNTFAQYLKIDNGITASRFVNGKDLPFLKSNVFNYSAWLGFDYSERNWFYLSSQIGYSVLGGEDRDFIIQGERNIIAERSQFLHLNTTFRAYKRVSALTVFAGVGPYADALVGSNRFQSDLYEGYKLRPFHLGGKGDIGVTHDRRRFRIGLVSSYFRSLTPVAKSDFLSLNNSAFSLSLTAGYRIR